MRFWSTQASLSTAGEALHRLTCQRLPQKPQNSAYLTTKRIASTTGAAFGTCGGCSQLINVSMKSGACSAKQTDQRTQLICLCWLDAWTCMAAWTFSDTCDIEWVAHGDTVKMLLKYRVVTATEIHSGVRFIHILDRVDLCKQQLSYTC